MDLAAYTLPIEDGMRVRHDAQARFTVKAGKKVLEDRLTPIENIGGAITVAGIMYNALAISGGTSWWDPTTGKPISKPSWKALVRPEDVLTGDQLCTCAVCI